MKYLLSLLLISSTLFVIGQNRETRNIDRFYDLNIQGPFKVELIQGESNKLELTSDMIPLDEIVTDMRSHELVLKLKSRVYLKEKYYDADYIRVKLYYSDIEEIKSSMGAVVKSKDVINQDYLRIESLMGAEVELKINVEDLYAKASMGGIMELEGKALYAEIGSSMGGEFQGAFFEADKADITSGMGGFVTIKANQSIRGTASMGGVIRYTGNPDRQDTSTILGGEIHPGRKN